MNRRATNDSDPDGGQQPAAPRCASIGRCRGRAPAVPARRGSVLVIVLVTIVFATAALTIFMERAGTDLLIEVKAADADRLRLEAYSALETTLAVLDAFHDVGKGLHSPAEGWEDPLAFANYEPGDGRKIEITFEDESGKLSLPSATAVTMKPLFESWGMTQSNAEKLADALLGWMKKEHLPTAASAPTADDYDRGELPFEPPERPLRSYGELAAIEYAREVFFDETGAPNDLHRQFVSAFSLYSFKNSNANAAVPGVFAALGADDPDSQRRLGEHRTRQGQFSAARGYFRNSQELAGVVGGQSPLSKLDTKISALRINLLVTEGQANYRLSVLVAPPGGATIPAQGAAKKKGDKESAENPDAKPAAAANSANLTGNNKNGQAKKLNYPFAVLEIRENDAAPLLSAAAPAAP